jgi:thiamine biosynthesis lipoprotein
MTSTTHAEAVMGTVFSFDVRGVPEPVARTGIHRAVAWLHWVDATFSTYRDESEISRLDRGELRENAVHPEVRYVLALSERLRVETDGFFDVRATGRLDPSGVVKGWSIERASKLLITAGCPAHLVDGGGDVTLHGRPTPDDEWHVGVVHPLRLDAYCAALHLVEGAVATSGTYERGFHVIDPHTRRPVVDLAAVTVVGPELTLADAYATAALAMGASAPAWLETLVGYDALVVDAEGQGWETSGFDRYRHKLGATEAG